MFAQLQLSMHTFPQHLHALDSSLSFFCGTIKKPESKEIKLKYPKR